MDKDESMRRIIFLDIDGVLISQSSFDKYKSSKFDSKCVDNLNTLLAESSSEIVISSTWRIERNLKTLRKLFSEQGIVGQIIDATPIIQFAPRVSEIELWLKDNNQSCYIIIDDEEDMAHLNHRLVKPRFVHGLTKSDTITALRLFNTGIGEWVNHEF